MLALDAAEIDGDLALERQVLGFLEIMAQQNVFRRDRGIGFELEDPVSIFTLAADQRLHGAIDVVLQPIQKLRHLSGATKREIGRAVARPQRAFDRRRQAGIGPVAGEEQVRPHGSR